MAGVAQRAGGFLQPIRGAHDALQLPGAAVNVRLDQLFAGVPACAATG